MNRLITFASLSLLPLLVACAEDPGTAPPPVKTPLSVQTRALRDATVGDAYMASIEARGGSDAGYTWTVSDGALPGGLSLGAAGTPSTTLTGTPDAAGMFAFTITVTDSDGESASAPFTITVGGRTGDPTIVTTSLPDAVLDEPYAEEVSATGGSGAGYTWTIVQGNLPTGLTLQDDAGDAVTIAGRATQLGTFAFDLQVQDSEGAQARQSLSIVVREPATQLTITTRDLPPARVARAYTASLRADGGTGMGHTWTIAQGNLPPGLSLTSGRDATISGTPTMQGSFTFQVQVQDSGGATANAELSITVAPPPPPLTITARALPNGAEGLAYRAVIEAAGGTGAGYDWTVSSGALPPGLQITAGPTTSATISGTPTAAGRYTFDLRITDDGAGDDTQTFVLLVSPGLQIVTADVPAARQSTAFTASLNANYGVGAHTWSVSAGQLPPGLSLSPTTSATVTLSGSPTFSGTYAFTLQVQDDAGQQATRAYNMLVYVRVGIQTLTVPNGRVNVPYRQELRSINGTQTNYAWSVTSGSLPPGLTLTSSGTPAAELWGRPTASGTYNFTVTLTDSSGDVATASYTLEVLAAFPPLSITTASLPDGNGGQPYNELISATGGSGQGYRWSVVAGALPPGLTLQAMATPDAALTGAPTTDGSYTFTVRVQDDSSTTPAERAFTVTIRTALQFVTRSLPAVTPVQSYVATITGRGGSGTGYTWRITTGQLPTGLTLQTSGTPATQISGTTSQLGPHHFTMELRDSAGATVTQSFRLFVGTPAYVVINGDLDVNGDIYNYVVDLSGSAPSMASIIHPTLMTGMTDVRSREQDNLLSPDGTKMALRCDCRIDSRIELFVVDLTLAPLQLATLVHTPIMGNAEILTFKWSPDSTKLVYRYNDRATPNNSGLYVTDVSGPVPGPPALVVDWATHIVGFQFAFHFSPDSNKVAFLTNSYDIYFSDISGATPTPPRRLNGPLGATQRCDDRFLWTPDSRGVVYMSDEATAGQQEVWYGDASGPNSGPPVRLNGPMAPGGDVWWDSISISEDGAHLVYSADEIVQGQDQVFLVDLRTSPPQNRGPIFPLGTGVQSTGKPKISPDSSKVVVRANNRNRNVFELFVVDISGPLTTTATLASGVPLPTNCDVFDFEWAPDSARLLFTSDIDPTTMQRGTNNLYTTRISGPLPWNRELINQPIADPRSDIDRFFVSPRGDWVAYLGDPTVFDRREMFVANLSSGTPGPPVQVSGSQGNVQNTTDIFFVKNGDGLVFRADPFVRTVLEAIYVDLSGATPAPAIRLHRPLGGGFDVFRIFGARRIPPITHP